MVSEKKNSISQPAWGATAASILNGCFGDYLNDRDNGLAIDMAFYQNNRPLELSADALRAACPNPTDKLCVLVHGLCCHEGVWDFPGDPVRSYGRALQHDLGYTPFALRYNTGLPIPYNGQVLDTLLEQLLAAYSGPVDELILIGHSMGGWIALNLAVDHREKIDSIIIAGASTRVVSPLGPGRPLHFLVPLIGKLANKMDWVPVYADTGLAQSDPSYRWVPMDSTIQLFDFMKATQKRLSEVNIPIQILHSKNDSMNSPEGAKTLYDSISTPKDQKRLVWFEQTGHYMFLDCEREEVNRTVVEFVKERIENQSILVHMAKQL